MKSRIKTRGYYRKSERFHSAIGLVGTIVIALWLQVLGAGITLNSQEVEASEYKKPVVVVQPKDVEMTEKQQIMSYIIEVFGDDADDAITIINKCENSQFNPKATNWNRNGTWDTGIFQVNEIHGYTKEEMQDWRKNIDAAKKIFDKAGKKWTPWSCAHVVGQKPFYMN